MARTGAFESRLSPYVHPPPRPARKSTNRGTCAWSYTALAARRRPSLKPRGPHARRLLGSRAGPRHRLQGCARSRDLVPPTSTFHLNPPKTLTPPTSTFHLNPPNTPKPPHKHLPSVHDGHAEGRQRVALQRLHGVQHLAGAGRREGRGTGQVSWALTRRPRGLRLCPSSLP
jgi:hypothetical protein